MTRRTAAGFTLGLVAAAGLTLAQTPDTLTARLSWVPISLAQQPDVAGQGSVTATLSGRRLSIIGSFEGLRAAATVARLHQGVATGAGGPAIADLEITRDASGTLSGDIELDRGELAALRAGHLYIQLHAARGVPPDNAVLRGWLVGQPAASSRERRAQR